MREAAINMVSARTWHSGKSTVVYADDAAGTTSNGSSLVIFPGPPSPSVVPTLLCQDPKMMNIRDVSGNPPFVGTTGGSPSLLVIQI